MTNKISLVILAAGMGSRYGGLKQLDSFGQSGELIIDYSIYDALQAGFDEIVCVIREEMEAEFTKRVTRYWQESVPISHVYQRLDWPRSDLASRQKPWGTAHAIWSSSSHVSSPFAVINADDFYGRDSFLQMAKFLREVAVTASDYAMVSFPLVNTLSPHGKVSRGVCVQEGEFLQQIEEKFAIHQQGKEIVAHNHQGKQETLSARTPVSMNFWGFTPTIFSFFSQEFELFIQQAHDLAKDEFLIPTVIDHLIKKKQGRVKLLTSEEKWMGVTYPEDKEMVSQGLAQLLRQGKYPEQLKDLAAE